jgi:hypothetical protein
MIQQKSYIFLFRINYWIEIEILKKSDIFEYN